MKNLPRALLLACFATLLGWSRPSRAQQAVAFDMNGTLNSTYGGLGVGIDERFGYRTGLPRGIIFNGLILQPELIAGYVQMPWGTSPHGETKIGHAGGGLRIGLIGVLAYWLQPFVYGHVSYGHVSGITGTESGVLSDFGVALDLRSSWFSLGLHGSYDILSIPGDLRRWYAFGPHIEARWFSP